MKLSDILAEIQVIRGTVSIACEDAKRAEDYASASCTGFDAIRRTRTTVSNEIDRDVIIYALQQGVEANATHARTRADMTYASLLAAVNDLGELIAKLGAPTRTDMNIDVGLMYRDTEGNLTMTPTTDPVDVIMISGRKTRLTAFIDPDRTLADIVNDEGTVTKT